MLICLSGRFCSVVIFSNKIEVQFGFGIFINWYSHEFMSGLMVIIDAKKILASG